MKILLYSTLFVLVFCFFSNNAQSQTKVIASQELGAASGIFFAASMTPTTLTITIDGPDDRWFGFGIGVAMSNADALLYTDGKLGSMHALGVRDYDLNAQNAAGVDLDAIDNWTLISNTTLGGVRTIVASRSLNTGDPVDHTVTFAAASLNIVWAKSNTADFTLSYHGGGNRGPASLPWTLVDVIPPAISGALIPTDNSVGVSLSQNLQITFDESIALGSGLIELRELVSTNLVEQFNVASSPNLSVVGAQLTIDPTSLLLSLTDYYLTIPSGAIEDLVGNIYAGFTDNATWNFQSMAPDLTPPALAGPFIPADDAIGVALSSNLIIDFDEDVVLATGIIELRESVSSTLVEQYDVATSPNVVVTSNLITINPTAILVDLTGYYVTIPSGAIEDLVGNAYVGFTDDATWNFITLDASSDTISPVLSGAFTPIDEATAVSLTTNLVVTFDEDVATGIGTIQLKDLFTNALIESFDVATSPNVSISTNQVTVDLTSDLIPNAQYFVVIDSGAIIDLAGNPYTGFTDNATWNFAAPISSLTENESLFTVQFNENNLLTIGNTSGMEYSLRLISLSGLVLKEVSRVHENLEIDLSSISRGMILVQLENAKGMLSKKIMLY
ncbi:MAG: hypothetical protein ACI837_002205 [Crocinitomicaceae bacterium]|jgi:hypothetical protein